MLDYERNGCKPRLREDTRPGMVPGKAVRRRRAALYHAIQESQVGLLTRLNSWSPLVCELLLWDQAT